MLAVAPHTGVIMMTMAEDVDGVARAVNAGARGYLVKDASREELTTMVTQALADAAAARSMPKMTMDADAGLPTLTERELQVLRGWAGVEQRRDRQRTLSVGGHGEDARAEVVPQAGCRGPRTSSCQGVPLGSLVRP